MATKLSTGDYRRVSKEVWDKFCEYYEGCGPAIQMPFKDVNIHTHYFLRKKYCFLLSLFFPQDPVQRDTGLYDTTTWVIDNSNFKKYIEDLGDGDKLNNVRQKKTKKLLTAAGDIYHLYVITVDSQLLVD